MELSTETISACILDMDGVVTDTARIHAAAWKRLFDAFLRDHADKEHEEPAPFDIDRDYRAYVDGKPRYDGVGSFLASRGISLPYGDPADSPAEETICGLGNRKNGYFLELLDQKGVTPYGSTIDFIRQGRRAGIRFGLISASRNARRVLSAAGLEEFFEVVVDGLTAAELGLAGKPAADVFLEAARRLEVEVERTAVIEDATAGVRAGRNGGFALVIGIDRGGQAEDLYRSGADEVVTDLAEITIVPPEKPRSRAPSLPSALDAMEAIFKKLLQGTPAVFLDYDGTLTPIVRDRSRARLGDRNRQILAALASHMLVAVISGRALADIRELVDLEEILYAGSHGFETSQGGGFFKNGSEEKRYLAALDRAEGELTRARGELAGVDIERKPFAIALHYRQAAQKTVTFLKERLDELVRDLPELKKTGGKKIFELRPAVDWDKGRAIRSMLEQFHVDCSRVTPLYIGDDETDEDAFAEIADHGIPILVSREPRPTAARYLLADTAEVTLFLEGMADRLGWQLSKGIWTMAYRDFDPDQEKLRESLCTLGNGYFASRGAASESTAGKLHYPGTYPAGCYNRRQSRVAGELVENESLVNVANWLALRVAVDDGNWFSPERFTPLAYSQELDMAAGVLTKEIRFKAEDDTDIRLSERRFVSMDAPHLAGLETGLTAPDRPVTIRIRTALDGRVENSLVVRYRPLNNDHLDTVAAGADHEKGILWLETLTNQSRIRIGQACRTRFFVDGRPVSGEGRPVEKPDYIGRETQITLEAGQTLRIEKIAALYTSRDRAISECLSEARQDAALAPGFASLLADHRRAWQHLWRRCGLEVKTASPRIAQILNLHIFHLLQTVSVHSIDLDAGVPPRGLHGEAYRGLIMWDELFVFPFLNLRITDLTRALLLYRYRRLPQARRAAREAGLDGAMFPWQSGSNGREEAQTLHLNPQSNHWVPDDTQLQRHINLAVAYNVWQFYQVTGDINFISFYGAEMLIEIARFCAALASYNPDLDRYEIKGVMGPDEFHTRYPDRDEPGLDNNAYTNVMAVWVLCRALDVLKLLPEERRQPLWENLGLREEEIERWDEMSRKMRVVFHGNHIISQFEGYDRLREFDWDHYRRKYTNIQRLDRILEKEGDSPDRYRLSKQADVLMLFYLFSAEELGQLFRRLGYPFTGQTIPANIDYYLKRTSHGSTLSRVVHAWVLSRSRREQSWHLFCDALNSDVTDIQGGTTHEGIHLGAMAGTVDLVQRCYTGLETRNDALWFNPALPAEIRELSFNILYRRHWLGVTIRPDTLIIESQGTPPAPITVGMGERSRDLFPGQTIEFPVKRRSTP